MHLRLKDMILLAVAASSALFNSGCASSSADMPWPPKWNAIIGNIEVHPSRIQAEAWQGASGVDVSSANQWAANSYKWSGGDNIVGLVGGIVSSRIAKGQQRDFDTKNTDVLPRLQALFGASLTRSLDQAVLAAARNTSLKSRLQPPYQSKLYADVINCGFERVGVDPAGEVLLTPYIKIKVTLLNTNPPRVYLDRTLQGNAAATHQHSARAYVTDAALTDCAFKAILDPFEAELTSTLKHRLGE
jgi:hypothetical protein